MKTITLILLSLFLGKGCSQETKNDIENTSIEYVAYSRGFYQKIIIKNQMISIARDRNTKGNGITTKISEKDWKELIGYFQSVKIENLPTLKDPTQQRFYDGAPIANLKVTYKENEYLTTDFDHSFPPAEIENLVNKIVSLGKQE
jgi:hypothetical protein